MTAEPRSDAAEPDLAAVAEAIHDEIERGLAPDVRALAARFSRSERVVGELVDAAVRLRELERRARGRALAQGDLARGTKVGDFVVESVLGRGGMATVYLARQPALRDRAVALKVLAEQPGSAVVELLETEAAEASRLHHPSIAELYDFGIDGGAAYYAMRLVEGPTLAEVLDDLRASPRLLREAGVRRRIARWTVDVAAALEHAHARGLVHRDVKPSNVMLARRAIEGEALPDCPAILVDFGLVCSPRGTPSGLRCGTREYASPEQQEGRAPDERSDVFSLGATLHDLLTATAPNERDPAAAGLHGIDTVSSEIEADLAAIAGMATDPDPRWRYPSAAAFRRDLEAWLAGDPVAARRWSAAERALWWTRRHPLRLFVGVAVAVALALVGFAFAELADAFRAARSARAAYAAAQPVELVAALGAVPPLFAGVVLRDPELARLRARVRDDRVTDPIEVLATLERDQDASGALAYAATLMRKEGLAAHALVLRYFCGAIADPVRADRRAAATALAARLMYERPDRTDADSRASAPLRDVLRGRWREVAGARDAAPERGAQDACFGVLTALSGCGTTEDLDRLVEAALGEREAGERLRCEIACAERILRRMHVAGHPARLGDRPWWPRFRDLARRLIEAELAGGETPPADLVHGTVNLAVATLLADRACGSTPAIDALVSPETVAGALDRRIRDLSSRVATLLAAAGDHRVAAWTTSAIPFAVATYECKEAGRRCGLLGDDDATELARARIEALERSLAGAAGEFHRGFAAAVEERAGIKRDYDPDESSLLDWDAELPAFEERPIERGELERMGALAEWSFERPAVRIAGGATGAAISALAHDRSDDTWLLGLQMAQFGRSTVRLDFEIVATVRESAWIGLWHMAQSREYHAWRGVAFVEVALDGEALDPGLGVGDFAHVADHVRIPSGRLTAGPHTLSIRLTDRSSTTYRLHQAWIATEH